MRLCINNHAVHVWRLLQTWKMSSASRDSNIKCWTYTSLALFNKLSYFWHSCVDYSILPRILDVWYFLLHDEIFQTWSDVSNLKWLGQLYLCWSRRLLGNSVDTKSIWTLFGIPRLQTKKSIVDQRVRSTSLFIHFRETLEVTRLQTKYVKTL